MPVLRRRGVGATLIPERPQVDGQAIGAQARQIADALRGRAEGMTSLATPAIASATDFLGERLEMGAKGASELATQAADVASVYGARAARAISDVSARGADVLSGRGDDAAAVAASRQAVADELARAAEAKPAPVNRAAWIVAGVVSLLVIVAFVNRAKIRQLIESSQPYQSWRASSDADAEAQTSDPEDDAMAVEAES